MLNRTQSYLSLTKARIAGLFAIVLKYYLSVLLLGISSSVFCLIHAWYLLWKDPETGGIEYDNLQKLNWGSFLLSAAVIYCVNRWCKYKWNLYKFAFEQALFVNLIYGLICYIYTVFFNEYALVAGGALMIIGCIIFSHFIYKLFSTKIA